MDSGGPRSQMGGKDNSWNFGSAKETGIKAHQKVFPNAGPEDKPCSEECLSTQLDNYHKQYGVADNKTALRADNGPLQDWQKEWGDDVVAEVMPKIGQTANSLFS